MNVKHLVWVLPLALVTGLLVGYFDAHDRSTQAAPTDKIEAEMSHYWACMDGCFNMQLVLQGKVDQYNVTQELQHKVCAGLCCKGYMSTLGCSS